MDKNKRFCTNCQQWDSKHRMESFEVPGGWSGDSWITIWQHKNFICPR